MKKSVKKTVSLLLSLAFLLTLLPVAVADAPLHELTGNGIYVTVDENMSMSVFRVEADGTKTPMTQAPEHIESTLFPTDWRSDGQLPWSTATGTSNDTDFVAGSAKLLSSKSGYVTTGTRTTGESVVDDFVTIQSLLETNVSTYFGTGDRLKVEGVSNSAELSRYLIIETAYDLPGTISVTSSYRFFGDGILDIARFVENNYKIVDTLPIDQYVATKREAGLFTYQGAALVWGSDSVVPVFDTMGTRGTAAINAEKASYRDLTSRNNWFWGENGGVPYNDFYGNTVGIGIGSAMPYQVGSMELPTRGSAMTGQHDTAYTWIGWPGQRLRYGDAVTAGTSIVTVHNGDYYDGAAQFSKAINKLSYKGTSVALPAVEDLPDWAYNPQWETWGMGENYDPVWVVNMIDQGLFEELGVKCITYDAGWYKRDENNGEGMYLPDPAKYVNVARKLGLPDPVTTLDAVHVVRALNDYIHAHGMYVVAWSMPSLAYVAGTYSAATHVITNPTGYLWTNHKDWLASATEVDMSPAGVAAGNVPAPWVEGGYYNNSRRYDFCLANPAVLEGYTTEFANLHFGDGPDDYNFDGLKIDSLWGSHPCYAEGHGHDGDPQASIKAYSQFYQKIYEKGRALKEEQGRPNDIWIENCNCGTQMNYFDYNGTNRPIPGDNTSARQVRYWTKLYRGFYGANYPTLSDHLERRKDSGNIDFISHLGVGTVLESKFRIDNKATATGGNTMLFPGEAAYNNNGVNRWGDYVKFFTLNNERKLSAGTLENLYRYGIDYPEAYAFKNGTQRFYSFYATNFTVGTAFNAPNTTYKGACNSGDRSVSDPWSVADSINYNGTVELRGLTPGKVYQISNYVDKKPIGSGLYYTDSTTLTIPLSFKGGVILQVDLKGDLIPATDGKFSVSVTPLRKGASLNLMPMTQFQPVGVFALYSSSNPSVATVDPITGVVVGVKPGMALIQARALDQSKTISILITVTM